MFVCVVRVCVCLGDFRGTLLVSSPLVRGSMFRLGRIREDPPPLGGTDSRLRVARCTAPPSPGERETRDHRCADGSRAGWVAAEGGDNENKRQKEGWMISVKGKKKNGGKYLFSSSSSSPRCDQSDSGGRRRPARLACSGNKAKLRDKRDDRVTHSRRMGKPTAPLTLYSHRGADTETSVLPPLPSCFLLPLWNMDSVSSDMSSSKKAGGEKKNPKIKPGRQRIATLWKNPPEWKSDIEQMSPDALKSLDFNPPLPPPPVINPYASKIFFAFAPTGQWQNKCVSVFCLNMQNNTQPLMAEYFSSISRRFWWQ